MRVRVQWTSVDRPDGDSLKEYRGPDRLRLGTGVIFSCNAHSELSDSRASADECDVKRPMIYWSFTVKTACHVVFNTEEAKKTRLDLFHDDERCQRDGRMKTLNAVEVIWSNPYCDESILKCVTHDAVLAERIKSSLDGSRHMQGVCHKPRPTPGLSWTTLSKMSHRFSKLRVHGRSAYLVIVSHPHGQPKILTVGKRVSLGDSSQDKYYTATCPGSSGSPLILVGTSRCSSAPYRWIGNLHSGTYRETPSKLSEQINYSSNKLLSLEAVYT